MNEILRKVMVFTIMGFFIGAGIVSGISSNVTFDDEIDQKQESWFQEIPLYYFYGKMAQSFQPSLNTLTRIQLPMSRYSYYGTPGGPLTVSIKSSLDGSSLTSKLIPLASLPEFPSVEWIDIDFVDINVKPHDTYYMVFEYDSEYGDDCPVLYIDYDLYPRGSLWIYYSYYYYGWLEYDYVDFAFRTYGRHEFGNLPPSVSITNPSNGETVDGSITLNGTTFDPNGDAIKWVMLNIDSTGWLDADGTSSWTYELDTTTLEDGRHTLTAICYDGRLQSPAKSIEFYVDNTEDPIPEKNPDLECDGSLSWSDIKPGLTVTNSFIVKNIGDEDSELNWEITEKPDWGTWTFSQEEGNELTPESGEITIQVSVIAPDEKEQDFSGHITIINKENASDFEIIDVSLSTSKTKTTNTPFLTFLQNHPHLFPIIRKILGLK